MVRYRVVVGALLAAGCHSSKGQPAVADGGANTTAATLVRHGGPIAPARFSRPIAALRAPGAVTLVAGLVAPANAIALTALGPDGATRWTHDVITDVKWSANATLAVLPSPSGAVVVWRGLRGGQDVTVAAPISAAGAPEGEPYAVAAATCATASEVAWVDHGPKGTWLVKTRAFAGTSAIVAATLPEDRDPALLCGVHGVFALGDGEDDVTLSEIGLGTHGPPLRVMQDTDFRGDEERGHEVYAVGDVLGVVRIGLSGSLAARELKERKLDPWRRFGKKLTDGDDVALVDADTRNAVVAFTRVASAKGDDSGAATLAAFVWERSGTRDASYELAAVDATRARGPFWSGAVTGGIAVAWVERSAHADGGAPIVGMAYRVVSVDGQGELHRVERPADDLVDAGCDDTRCYAVALARAEGEDGGQPEVAAVLAYP